MPNPIRMTQTIKEHKTALLATLADQSVSFFQQVDRLTEAASDAPDQAAQKQIADQVQALVAQYPAAQALLATAEPTLFSPTTADPDLGSAPTHADTTPPTNAAPTLIGAAGEPPPSADTAPTLIGAAGEPPPNSPQSGPSSTTFVPTGQLHKQPDAATSSAPANGTKSAPANAVKETRTMAQTDSPASPAQPSWDGARFREEVAAILALTLVVGTVALIALAVYRGDGSEGTKNLLLLLTPLCGVVVGYYFGRIPSEAQAQAATARATQAVGEAARIKTTATDLIDEAADLGDKYAGGGGGPESATRSSDPAVVSVPPGLQRDLRELQKRARRLL